MSEARQFSPAEQRAEEERLFIADLRAQVDQLRRERDEALMRRDGAVAEAASIRLLALKDLPERAEYLLGQRRQAMAWAMMTPVPPRR
jgi:ABC-type uncharacterized transport system ATPase component